MKLPSSHLRVDLSNTILVGRMAQAFIQELLFIRTINSLTSSVHKNAPHTSSILQLKAVGLFKYT